MNDPNISQLTSWREHMTILRVVSKSNELVESEHLLLRAYERGKAIFGPDHGEVGLILVMLAEVCEKQGKADLAREYRNEADKIVAIYRADFGEHFVG
jgi:hypothetical protein